ncbi:hypothetical protein SO802_025615 [Lithocarpus litseifolius]|uniref:Reverse transcriptase zinc-binding domain-containing protein n=1 Tax=Lithocarpus litseifolius TaxID=425828 RepID=A0AAW2C2S4_9ROSI
MGFSDLQKFNDALLAKQVWRLLTNEDSLFYRFFKAKFFPSGSIPEVKEGVGSFAWKSILKGRGIVQNGLLWRVGNGSSIQMYHNNWLPDPSCKKVLSTPHFFASHEKVSALIDNERHCWAQESIDANFFPFEASLIKAIPLSFDDCRDVITWPLNCDGVYSVRSGYHLLLDMDLNELPRTSNLSTSKRFWKGIWGLKVPNRVKNLMWRAGSDSLPSKSNLRRKIPIDDTCSNCGLESETTLHAIWSCPLLVPVWTVHFGWLIREVGMASSFLDVLHRCAERSNCMDLLAMTVSQIWSRRKKLRVGEAASPLSMINQMAANSLQVFRQSSLIPPKAPSPPKAVKWLPPPPSCKAVKL